MLKRLASVYFFFLFPAMFPWPYILNADSVWRRKLQLLTWGLEHCSSAMIQQCCLRKGLPGDDCGCWHGQLCVRTLQRTLISVRGEGKQNSIFIKCAIKTQFSSFIFWSGSKQKFFRKEKIYCDNRLYFRSGWMMIKTIKVTKQLRSKYSKQLST